MRHLLTVCLIASGFIGLWPASARAEFIDLAITADSIRFSEDTLYADETVRIYATITNSGDTDSIAQVFFYTSDVLIGESQPISVLAGGGDDVYVDFDLPEGSFNIRAVIQGADPEDSTPANNEAITPLFSTISDNDRDGALNDEDNCPDSDNLDQANLDGDNQGDACDEDIDNDGVTNDEDDFPLDQNKSNDEPAPLPTPTPTPSPAPVAVVNETVALAPEAASAELAGVAVTDEGAVLAEAVAIALDLSGFGSGAPISSPAAQFTYEQINWRTYEFVAKPPLGGDELTFAWDFDDGATSVQATITHTFPTFGVYSVSLAILASDGTILSDSQDLVVSFFHLSNPWLLLCLGVLLLIMAGLTVLVVRLRRGE